MKRRESAGNAGIGRKIVPKKIVKFLAETKIRFDRGNALIYWIRTVLIGVIGIKLFLPDLNFIETVLIGIVISIVIYLIGCIDIEYMKLYQTEQELGTGKYNPYFVKLKKKW